MSLDPMAPGICSLVEWAGVPEAWKREVWHDAQEALLRQQIQASRCAHSSCRAATRATIRHSASLVCLPEVETYALRRGGQSGARRGLSKIVVRVSIRISPDGLLHAPLSVALQNGWHATE